MTLLGYSPLDFTVLDPHWGPISEWQQLIDEIHNRGMYIMVDFTVGTMADLVAFDGCVGCVKRWRRVLTIVPQFPEHVSALHS